MTWEWQVWRCFDNVRETFEEKGWEYGLDGRFDNDAMPLLAESGDLRVVFYERDPGTGVCWFELRDEARRSVVYVRGTENIPAPERATALLESHGAPLRAVGSPCERPLYELPLAPVLKAS
ncbi:hypothetical protein BH24ACT19_BH24ACT19_08380 [soil metagenome]|jgi:hypothetical protein